MHTKGEAMKTRRDREKPLSELAGRAVRRLSGLAGSGVDLGILSRTSREDDRELDKQKKAEKSCRMRRFALAPAAVLAAVTASLLGASPAHAVTGGCSVQTAPVIQSGQTQTSDSSACGGGSQYWAIDAAIGDTLAVAANPLGQPWNLAIYGPNIGTIGDWLCQKAGAYASTTSCLIPAGGRYLIVTSGDVTFTPTMKAVRRQKGRVEGACDPVNTPAAESNVTQYANGMVCRPSGTTQYWSMSLHRGDTLTVNSLAIASTGNAEPFDVQVYGPSPSALGSHLCGNTGLGPAYSFECPILKSGRYVLAAANSGSFTPLVTHPTHIRRPQLVKGGGAAPLLVKASVQSDAPDPTGTCYIQEQSGHRWISVAHVRTTTGVIKRRVKAIHRGKLRLRIRFKGAKGWASSTSKPTTIRVP